MDKSVFEEVARSTPLMPGAVEVVVALRKAGFHVGIVSDSYRLVADVVRRRVFADFSIAHMMRFRRGRATGEITLSPAMQHANGCRQHNLCKLNVLLHVCEQFGIGSEHILAVGDSDPDACMLKAAGISVAFQPKSKAFESSARHVIHGSLLEIMTVVGGVEACSHELVPQLP